MAELSNEDKRAIFGADYKAPEVTEASRAEQRAANRASVRTAAIVIAIVAALVLIAMYFRS